MAQEKQIPRVKRAPINKDHLSFAHALKPMTEAQREFIQSYVSGNHVIAVGSAGTGKTFLATYMALQDLFDKKIEKIVIVRSAVEVRSMGFLPGSESEKAAAYTVPYKQLINEMLGNGTAWDILTKKDMIQFITTSYTRGITLDNCIVIVDEVQNMNKAEIYTIMTRAGKNCKLIICGDTRQCDLQAKREESCYTWLMSVSDKLTKWVDVVHFLPADIVRSDFVKALIMANESL